MQLTVEREQKSGKLGAEADASGKLGGKNGKGLQAFLSSAYAAPIIALSFLSALTLWYCLDQSIPGFDPAWHAVFSSTMRRFLTHFKEWSVDNFMGLLRQHFNYPAGGWLFNGGLKVILGDSIWADRGCLIVQAVILAFSFYKLSMLTWKDRVKANAGLLALLCTPVVSGLAHLPLLDLLQTASFVAYLAALTWWYQQKTWKITLAAALLFGFYCSTKQIAVLYGAPILAILAVYLLVKKQYRALAQCVSIGAAGPIFLLTWIIPNFADLVSYCVARNGIGASFAGKCAMVWANFKLSSWQICQSISPLILASCAVLLLAGQNSYQLVKKAFIPVFAGVFGWLLLISFAYYNTPEPRYFGPMIAAVCVLFGGALGESLNASQRWKNIVATALMILAPIQILALNFAPAPYVKRPVPLGVSPIYQICGITGDTFLKSHIACEMRKDPWKQHWVFKTVQGVEKIRYVWLCVLPSTWEFNQGSMSYLSHLEKSHVIPITWRCTNPDMTDNFVTNEQLIQTVDWFVVKSGFQGTELKPQSAIDLYTKVQKRIETGGDFLLVDKTSLPDGSELRLYRKDYVKQWNRQAAALRKEVSAAH